MPSRIRTIEESGTLSIASLRTGTLLASVLLASATGCARHGGILGVDCCADIPAGAIPEPPGSKVCQWQAAQVNAAIVDQNVLYRADFVEATEVLSPGAMARLARHAHTGLAETVPWIVEPSGDVELDHRRVAAVSERLSELGLSGIDVSLATPAALGLAGVQAEGAIGGALRSRGTSQRNQSIFSGSSVFPQSFGGGIFQ